MRRQGFTLVELLVCLAVISVLFIVVLPLLLRRQKDAQRLQCAYNMRNLSVAFNHFSQANDDRFPGGMTYNNSFDRNGNWTKVPPWLVAIFPYYNNWDTGRCPSDRERACMSKVGEVGAKAFDPIFEQQFKQTPKTPAEASQMLPWSYASNGQLGMIRIGAALQWPTPGKAGTMRHADVESPAQTWVMTDFGRGSAPYSVYYCNYLGYRSTTSWYMGRRHTSVVDGRNFAFLDCRVQFYRDPTLTFGEDLIPHIYQLQYPTLKSGTAGK